MTTTTPLHPAFRTFIERRLPDGLDASKAVQMAELAANSRTPETALRGAYETFGDRFTPEGLEAFRAAARAAGYGELSALIQADEMGKKLEVEAEAATAKTRASIEQARSVIASLEQQISNLERLNSTKLWEVNSLVSRIEERESEIRSSRRKKRNMGILGAMFGMPMVTAVSMMEAMSDDDRLRELNSSLSSARYEQQSITAKLERHRTLKATLTTQLEKLRSAEATLAAPTTKPSDSGTPKNIAQLQVVNSQLVRYESLHANLKSQVEILIQIRDSAASVGVALDELIASLQEQANRAEQLAQESQKALFELLDILSDPNPEAAAKAWIENKVKAEQKKIMKQLERKIGDYAKHLANKVSPNNAAMAELLRNQIVASIQNAIKGVE